MVTGVALAPLAMPILPVGDYVRYTKAMGIAPSTPENQKLSDLPQFFADMNGWEELARDVSVAYRSIPQNERRAEDSLGIFIARQRRAPIEEDWPKAKHFE